MNVHRSWFHSRDWRASPRTTLDRRIGVMRTVCSIVAVLFVARLFQLQIIQHGLYTALAGGQHEVYRNLFPRRGDILVTDRDGKQYPVAANARYTLVALDLRKIENPTRTAKLLAERLGLDEFKLKAVMTNTEDPYEPIAHRVPDAVRAQLEALKIPGLILAPEDVRLYPEPGMGGHLLGFLGSDADGTQVGRYGIEGYYDKELRGTPGFLSGERDPAGRLIPSGSRALVPALHGASLVLTIDRTVQFFACEKLAAAVKRHDADGGSVVVFDPKTGEVIALCGAPDFDPNTFGAVADSNIYNNPALFADYEPGSVIKPLTLAAALEEEKIRPDSTYVDEGTVVIGPHTIKNSDGKAHGVQTMTQVLEESLNTGAIFAMRQIGTEKLRSYFERFGFGQPTGIDLETEVVGTMTSLREHGEIYAATASFGQGITVTPIQLAAAFGALANEGRLMRPHVVREILSADGSRVPVNPEPVGQAVSPRVARLMGAMLVSVVEKGHGKRAGVKGYYVAGKTGTAQVPRTDGPGYQEGVTIGTFVGYAPVEDPRFAIVVRIDHPRDVQFAESSAAPLFGQIAEFLLHYYQIRPTR